MARYLPTYVVAVANGSIYMGNSPNQLTLCTNGASALEDTPLMDMQAGLPSPNDTVEAARYQRHMYFCDGERYKRLNAHTGEVRDWEAYNGDDALNPDIEVRGVLPFSADITTNITGESSGQPVVAGDKTDAFDDGDEAIIQNLSVDGDGSYTVVSTSYDAMEDETTITLDPNPNISEPDGNAVISRVTGRATIIAYYRERLVLAGLTNDPSNWFMSAAGDPLNWDYGPEVSTVTQAVAGSLNEAGRVGDIVTTLVPFSDDLLLIGGEHSMWVLRGDPAAGGQIDNLSRQIGVVGNEAWAFDPSNSLYVFGNDGLYRISPDATQMTPLSAGKLDKTFAEIDFNTNRVLLEYDRDRHFLYIFLVNDTQGGENPEGYIFDTRTESFWPMKLPDENGPTATLYFESPTSEVRGPLLGGRDGFLRSFRDRRADDNDGTSDVAHEEGVDAEIESYVALPPAQPFGPGRQWRAFDTEVTLGGNSGRVSVRMFASSTPEQAVRAATPKAVAEARLNRSRFLRQRVAGQSIVFELYQKTAGAMWVAEGMTTTGVPAGRARKIR